MLRGEWWVVDIDRERQMYQQVAAIVLLITRDTASRLRDFPSSYGATCRM